MSNDTDDDKRPEWRFEQDMEAVRFLLGNIVKIEHKWEMTSADTSRNWIRLTRKNGVWRDFRDFPDSLFRFVSDHHASLIQMTHEGNRARELLDKIDAWDKKHAAERTEYERLKRKFET